MKFNWMRRAAAFALSAALLAVPGWMGGRTSAGATGLNSKTVDRLSTAL